MVVASGKGWHDQPAQECSIPYKRQGPNSLNVICQVHRNTFVKHFVKLHLKNVPFHISGNDSRMRQNAACHITAKNTLSVICHVRRNAFVKHIATSLHNKAL